MSEDRWTRYGGMLAVAARLRDLGYGDGPTSVVLAAKEAKKKSLAAHGEWIELDAAGDKKEGTFRMRAHFAYAQQARDLERMLVDLLVGRLTEGAQ